MTTKPKNKTTVPFSNSDNLPLETDSSVIFEMPDRLHWLLCQYTQTHPCTQNDLYTHALTQLIESLPDRTTAGRCEPLPQNTISILARIPRQLEEKAIAKLEFYPYWGWDELFCLALEQFFSEQEEVA